MFLPRRFLSVSLLSVLVMACLVGIERSLFGVRYFSERLPQVEPYNLWHAWGALSRADRTTIDGGVKKTPPKRRGSQSSAV
jgi:hypothetical protein